MTEQELILTSVLHCRRVDLYTQDFVLDKGQKNLVQIMEKKVAQGEPIQYVLGECEFFGLRFQVDRRVLIPRPETEMLVDVAVKRIQSNSAKNYLKILDLGTGSGNIAIALAKNIKEGYVAKVDVSCDAITLAQINARLNRVEQKIDFICADLTAWLAEQVKQNRNFDCIISNPPYVPSSQLPMLPKNVLREPTRALDGGEDGLDFYRVIIPAAAEMLSPEGHLFLEMGDDQAPHVVALARDTKKFYNIEVLEDLNHKERFVIACRQAHC